MKRLLFSCLFAIACCFFVSAAGAQTVINSVPYTIKTSGKYVLGGNLNHPAYGPAITINAPNVELDLGGFYISGAGNPSFSFIPVIYVDDAANVTIRNGTVANESVGILFRSQGNSRNYRVENMKITRCFTNGIEIDQDAPGTVIRNNLFSNIGGSTAGVEVSPFAIYASGGVSVEDNVIASVTPPGNARSYGVYVSAGSVVVGNRIFNCTVGVSGGKYSNNLTSGCTTPFSGGVDAGGNN